MWVKFLNRYSAQSVVPVDSGAKSHLFTTKIQGLYSSKISPTNCLSTFEMVSIQSKNISTTLARRMLRLARAKPDALVMHPGPMNRGIEIDSNVADMPGRSLITAQVEMGVAIRMACLDVLTRRARKLPGWVGPDNTVEARA